MRKRLSTKFFGRFNRVLALLLMNSTAWAGTYPLADTCQNPNPPILTGSSTAICRSETVTLSATNCSGTVIWSNGDTGNTITVQPQQTTKYTAICRAKPGCISCFAEVWKITVNTPDAPRLRPSSSLICPGETVTLTASNCAGTVRWPDQSTGLTWTGTLTETTTFRAVCEQNNCVSNPSIPVAVQVQSPAVPQISADQGEVCAGQPVQLRASGCLGIVQWSDGQSGLLRTVYPEKTMNYRAICQIGACQSDSSTTVSVAVRSASQTLNLLASLTNICPFQTADLSKAITDKNDAGLRYEFRTGSSLLSTVVQSPGAVESGTYYLLGRNADGCYTESAKVTVQITPCKGAISPCQSNPPTVSFRLDTLDWASGIVRLKGQLGGSATQFVWQSNGGGLFTDTGLNARYLLSETDRQRGSTTFTLTVADPDGSGPCTGASAQQRISAPSREIVGLSKKVGEPVWVTDGNSRLVELTYQLTAVNMGKHNLTDLKLSDDLDAVFTNVGAQVKKVTVLADSSLKVNAAYTGRGVDTVLVTGGSLPAGGKASVWLSVWVDVSQANTLTFSNKALVQAVDANGNLCRDYSTNGTDADPDQNGNPGNDSELTSVTLHSLRTEETERVFIPEGFSPNGDGINDLFIIQRVPAGITVQLDVYNRWGHLVYQQADYKNDWNGTANQGTKTTGSEQGLPDGTYYYQIRLSDGREFVRFITLAR